VVHSVTLIAAPRNKQAFSDRFAAPHSARTDADARILCEMPRSRSCFL